MISKFSRGEDVVPTVSLHCFLFGYVDISFSVSVSAGEASTRPSRTKKPSTCSAETTGQFAVS